LIEAAFNADVRSVVIGDLEKHYLDEHLGFGAIQVCDHLRNILAGLVIRDNNQPARLGIDRDHRVAHRAIGKILARGAAGGPNAPAAAAATTATETTPSPPTAARLSMDVSRNAQTQTKDADETFQERGTL
jgi:hypothetical protein